MYTQITPNFPHDALITVEVSKGVIVLTLDDRDELVSVRLDAAQAENLHDVLAAIVVVTPALAKAAPYA